MHYKPIKYDITIIHQFQENSRSPEIHHTNIQANKNSTKIEGFLTILGIMEICNIYVGPGVM